MTMKILFLFLLFPIYCFGSEPVTSKESPPLSITQKQDKDYSELIAKASSYRFRGVEPPEMERIWA